MHSLRDEAKTLPHGPSNIMLYIVGVVLNALLKFNR